MPVDCAVLQGGYPVLGVYAQSQVEGFPFDDFQLLLSFFQEGESRFHLAFFYQAVVSCFVSLCHLLPGSTAASPVITQSLAKW